MKYRNIVTGAIVDSSSRIVGKNWEVKEPKEEYVEEEVNLEEMTNKQLDDFAKEHDVELTAEDKKNKETRINAIAKAFE